MTRPTNLAETASSAIGSPRILVTAGPTWEPVDDVRFLGNRSSGRMGLEITRAAAELGLPVTLLRGPGVPEPEASDRPSEVRDLRFQTAAELDTLLRDCWPTHDILVMAAAVADHRPIRRPGDPPKRRRLDGPTTIDLEPVPDLLAGLAEIPHPGTRIGFALEPAEELAASARAKLARKRLHGIVANPLQTMDASEIDGRLVLPDGTERRPPSSPCSKAAFADWLVPELVRLHESRTD
jgi:phosphopantothenoylcysteine decarboxylase/phosphopantothenate--cysteine ligase